MEYELLATVGCSIKIMCHEVLTMSVQSYDNMNKCSLFSW